MRVHCIHKGFIESTSWSLRSSTLHNDNLIVTVCNHLTWRNLRLVNGTLGSERRCQLVKNCGHFVLFCRRRSTAWARLSTKPSGVTSGCCSSVGLWKRKRRRKINDQYVSVLLSVLEQKNCWKLHIQKSKPKLYILESRGAWDFDSSRIFVGGKIWQRFC